MCTLKCTSESLSKAQYILLVEEKEFSELPESIEVTEVPKIGRSTFEKFFGANTQRFDWLIFLSGRRVPVVLELNIRSGQVTLDVCGKPKMSWSAKKFSEIFEVPYNFTHDGHKFTLRMGVDDEGN